MSRHRRLAPLKVTCYNRVVLFKTDIFGGSSVAEQLAVAQIQRYTYNSMVEKRPYSQRAEYLKRAVGKRRHRVKEMSVEYLGGKCQVCGYRKCPQALDVHHRDPSKKILVLPRRDTRDLGSQYETNSICVSSSVQIVIEKFMLG